MEKGDLVEVRFVGRLESINTYEHSGVRVAVILKDEVGREHEVNWLPMSVCTFLGRGEEIPLVAPDGSV